MKTFEDIIKSELARMSKEFATDAIRVELMPISKIKELAKTEPWLLVITPVLKDEQDEGHAQAPQQASPCSQPQASPCSQAQTSPCSQQQPSCAGANNMVSVEGHATNTTKL